MTILQKSVIFNAVCWSCCLPCQFVLPNKLIWPISNEVNVFTVHFSWPMTMTHHFHFCASYSSYIELIWSDIFEKTAPVVSPPAMTVAKHEMCHSGALKPMMHTEWDFFRPRWINAFARLRTWKSIRKQLKYFRFCFSLANLLLILCKCPLHPRAIPLHGKGSSIWHLDFQMSDSY